MKPTSDTTLSRPDLGQVVSEVMEGSIMMGFIGLSVMPIFPVAEYTATYPVMPKESLFNIHDVKRAATGGYNRVSEAFEEGFYKTNDNGLEYPIDDRQAAIYSTRFAYERVVATMLINKILRAHEKRVADKIFNTTNFTANNASTAWSTTASADPVYDVEEGKDSLRSSGIDPDTLIIPYDGLKWLRQNDEIKDMVYKVFPDAAKTGRVTIDHLKTVFDVPKVLAAGALYNNAKIGQNASLADIWGSRYAMLCKTAEGPGADITVPSIGRTFLWNEGQNGSMPIVEEYREEGVRGNILRVRHDSSESFLSSYDEDGNVKSEISKACGYLIDMTEST
jgi:hypothetical protein